MILVGCGKAKQAVAAPARDLYTGALFRLARCVAEQHPRWAILSAQHHLLAPDDVIAPYDLHLAQLRPQERRIWAVRVREQLVQIGDPRRVVVLAGAPYVDALRWVLAGVAVEAPLEGLTLGRRMQRLMEMRGGDL